MGAALGTRGAKGNGQDRLPILTDKGLGEGAEFA
jgi:hypothetical protein